MVVDRTLARKLARVRGDRAVGQAEDARALEALQAARGASSGATTATVATEGAPGAAVPRNRERRREEKRGLV